VVNAIELVVFAANDLVAQVGDLYAWFLHRADAWSPLLLFLNSTI
jgi:hypothetical protein